MRGEKSRRSDRCEIGLRLQELMQGHSRSSPQDGFDKWSGRLLEELEALLAFQQVVILSQTLPRLIGAGVKSGKTRDKSFYQMRVPRFTSVWELHRAHVIYFCAASVVRQRSTDGRSMGIN